MLTIDAAFKEGLRLVREAGLPLKGGELPLLAAWFIFEKKAELVFGDPRFDEQGPLFAKQLILRAFAGGSDGNQNGNG